MCWRRLWLVNVQTSSLIARRPYKTHTHCNCSKGPRKEKNIGNFSLIGSKGLLQELNITSVFEDTVGRTATPRDLHMA
ncbi:hypothetical protein N7453_004729 [Penicillium expansum]|nr:hypothetical protein N7453_004729 [Penicillium expansum]